MSKPRLSISDFVELNEDTLIRQVQENFKVDDVFFEDQIVEWVRKNKDPEEVYSEKRLYKWAEENGYGGLK